MNKSNNLIVVLSRNYSTGLSVIRSLGAAGYTVDLVASAPSQGKSRLAACSKYVRNSSEVVSDKVKTGNDDALLEELLKYAGAAEEKPVLFPTDDYTTSVMDLNRDVLKDIFIMPEIAEAGQGRLTELMNKSIQCAMAREIGFPTAKEWVISLREEITEVPDEIPYPCFVKPPESIVGYKTEMAKCENAEELIDHLNRLRGNFAERDILVQEFLEIKKEIELDGLCVDQEIIVPAVSMNSFVAQYEKGVPIAGELVPFEDLGEVKDKVVKLLQKFRYTGMFDMGLLAIGDQIYFNELNLRSGGPNYAYYASGVNLPELFVKYVTGEAVAPEEKAVDKYGLKYFYEMVGWGDFFRGLLKLSDLKKCYEEADVQFIYNDEDPAPGEVYEATISKRRGNIERCVAAAVEETGWTEDEAFDDLRRTRQKYDITYGEYIKHRFWAHTDEGKQIVLNSLVKNKATIEKARERCIQSAMETAGWTREVAEEKIDESRNAIHVTYRTYRKQNFCLLTLDEQKAKLDELNAAKSKKEKKGSVVPTRKEDVVVVVLSRNYATGLSVIRSLGAAGYKVDLIASVLKANRSKIAYSSKYVNRYEEVVSKKINDRGDEKIIDKLMDYELETKYKPVLFPVDDYTASVMDLHRSILEHKFIMPSIVKGGNGSMVERMDKTMQSKLAVEAGLEVPQEWIISLRDTLVVPEDMVYPCFVKPIESITGYKQEMAKCDSEMELRRHLGMLQDKNSDRDILVQEFINIDDEIDFSGVCIDQKVIIPAIIEKTGIAQYEKGVTLSGRLVPFEKLGDLQSKVVNMLQLLRYTGMFDMELNVAGDKVYFNEINLRSGGPNYSYFASGVNLPDLFVRGALGLEFTEEDEKVEAYNKTFIYEKVAWEDYHHGFISRRQLNKKMKESDIHLLCNDDDPEPGNIFTEKELKKAKARRKKNAMKGIRKILINGHSIYLKYPQTKPKNKRNPNSELPRVLVAGRNYCSNLSIAKALGEAGYEVEVMRIFQRKPKKWNLMRKLKPDAYSKYIKAFYICVSNGKRKEIANKLMRIADEKRRMLLIPADDLVATVIDTNYEKLKDYYIMQNVNEKAGEVTNLMQKSLQTQMAREAGLPVLNSCLISSVNGKIEIPETVTYPCFVKPNVSVNSSKSKMGICHNEEELRNHFFEIAEKKDVEMLVEDCVEIKNEYSILGISTKDFAIGPAFFKAEKSGEEKRRGVAVTGRVLDTAEMQPLIDKLVNFVGSMKFEGLYDIDLIEDVNGNIYFAEVNMRFGASGYAFSKCGVNLPAMYADYMIKGTPVDRNCKVTKPDTVFVNEKELMDAYRGEYLTMPEIEKIMKEVDVHFIYNEDDPQPYNHFKKFYKVADKQKVIDKERELEKEKKAAELAAQEAKEN